MQFRKQNPELKENSVSTSEPEKVDPRRLLDMHHALCERLRQLTLELREARRQPAVKKWQHKLFGQAAPLSKEELDQLGEEGWELVCHETRPDKPKYHEYIFKRPKREIPDEQPVTHFCVICAARISGG